VFDWNHHFTAKIDYHKPIALGIANQCGEVLLWHKKESG
jgi:glycerol kinase